MSLTSMLNAAHRKQIDESFFQQALPADRQVLENILLVLQEYLPTYDISKAVLARVGDAYHISVLSANKDDKTLLSNLVAIQSFCPGRIANIEMSVKADRQCLSLIVHDETKPIPTSQIEIVRLCKRRRLNGFF